MTGFMTTNSESIEEIRNLLSAFNEGYSKRDPSALDGFMELFAREENLEFIATGGVALRRGTWRVGMGAVRDLVRADWEYWGVIRLDLEKAHIDVHNDIAWLSTTATITKDDETDEYLGDKDEVMGTVHNTSSGDSRVKTLRVTAVLVKRESRWQFIQIHTSFSIRSMPK
jgi:hypothetical protein